LTRTIIASTALATAALIATTVAIARPQAPITLKGTVGPGYTITLTKAGKKVTSLKAGSYKFVVSDKASIHNFILEKEKGGSFERDITSVGQTGTKTVTVKLTPGKWKYYCRPHEATMFGDFTVK